MWLGSPQQLAKVNVLEVPVASTGILTRSQAVARIADRTAKKIVGAT